jgi:hypothetical protein
MGLDLLAPEITQTQLHRPGHGLIDVQEKRLNQTQTNRLIPEQKAQLKTPVHEKTQKNQELLKIAPQNLIRNAKEKRKRITQAKTQTNQKHLPNDQGKDLKEKRRTGRQTRRYRGFLRTVP